ncbi:MAG TPA: ATP-binding protein [Spirochaetia bacterium]|nr:ATP-binding protein [Spirochaetia bacterium]
MDHDGEAHPLKSLDTRIFASIVEESPTSVIITDLHGNIEYVNRKFTTLTGYKYSEVLGKNPRLLKSGRQSPSVYEELWRIILAGREWRGELCNRKKNGELYWELAAISAIRGDDGAIAHFIAVKEDITDRKSIEELLRHAKASAEAANLAKSQFLANMSHELRTPLNSILGFSQLLEMQGIDRAGRPALTDKQREYLRWIRDGGEHLLDMVNDVLDLSKIEAGKVDLDKKPFDTAALIRRVLTTVRSLAAKKHLHIDTAIDPDLGLLDADEVRIKQVLYNLLSNAIKFTDREKKIGVEAHGRGDRCEITVWDEGIGIDLGDRERIFEPFEQLRKGHEGRGTGLGLTIVRNLVELHGGAVAIESEVGAGSRFTIDLPGRLTSVDGVSQEAVTKEAEETNELIPDLGGRTVLVVDDSPANSALMQRILSALGCRVLLAGSGEEALAVAGHSTCDAVFMDIHLPGMNGTEAMHRMREAGVRSPVVALTAYAMKGDRERFLADGFDDYIAKPIRIAEIVSFLEKL